MARDEAWGAPCGTKEDAIASAERTLKVLAHGNRRILISAPRVDEVRQDKSRYIVRVSANSRREVFGK
jgi:hypothetical protein